jgi:hypothetical protein
MDLAVSLRSIDKRAERACTEYLGDRSSYVRAVVCAAFEAELETNLAANAQLRETINKRLRELSMREDYYLDLVGARGPRTTQVENANHSRRARQADGGTRAGSAWVGTAVPNFVMEFQAKTRTLVLSPLVLGTSAASRW